MNVRVIANPIAGGGLGAARAEALAKALSALGCETELRMTAKAGDGTAIAAEPGAGVILAVGGDGTLNEVINGVKAGGPAVGILPVGTANVVARELGFSHDPELLARQATAGVSFPMDAGLFGGRRFLLGAGAGLDAAIVERVSRHRRRRSGLRKWVWPTIATSLSYAFPPMTVTVEGEPLMDDAQYVVVGNCRYSAGVFPATPRARVDDGLLDVLALRNLGAVRLIQLVATVWNPSFLEHRDVAYAQGTAVRIEPAGTEAPPLQIDGDPAGTVPGEFGIEPHAIRMLRTRP